MDLVTVGTGTVAPSATRTSACHWVGRGNLKILLDCGAGALHHLAQFGLPWHQVTHVVLSHFHPDHWGELPMLVYALKYTTAPPRQEPLVILGPRGVVRLVKQLAEGYGPWLLDPGFPIGILDEQAGDLAREAGARHLVLTHFYPPVETTDPARVAGQRFTGRVTAARDGDRFTIGGGRGGK